MCGDRFSSSTTCSEWRHETEPGRLDQSFSRRFWKVATYPPKGSTLGDLSDAYLQDYQVRQFRSQSTAHGRIVHLTAFFGRAARAAALTTYQIRQYQLAARERWRSYTRTPRCVSPLARRSFTLPWRCLKTFQTRARTTRRICDGRSPA